MKILALKIYTKHLSDQIDFYSNKIGLDIIEKSENQADLKIGNSILRIVQNDSFQPYHFAINIPCNQETEALEWIKKRVKILTDGQNEIHDFDFWNAKAIYFYDPDKNIAELIARKNLNNVSDKDFNVNSLLQISEIGMPVSDIKTTFNALNKISNVQKFDGGFERFLAIGDENGLFICINKNARDWYPKDDKAYSSAFEIKFEENGKQFELEFLNEEIKTVNNDS